MRAEMILLKKEPKTLQIISITKDYKGVYWVKFKSGKTFPYSNRDVHILKSPKEIEASSCRINNKQGKAFNPIHIWEYTLFFHRYYRIEFSNNEIYEYDGDYLKIEKSVLADKEALNIFNYLKDVSSIQYLVNENGRTCLLDKYNKIDFVSKSTVLGSYLKPKLMHSKQGYAHLVFPFYSNLSQMQAVGNAFKSQISIVQGPPGTGKTQTILNIVANIVLKKETVLIVSNNNSAVENVKEKLDKEGLGFIVAKLGKYDNRNAFIQGGQTEYPDMSGWYDAYANKTTCSIDTISRELRTIFEKQNLIAKDRQELKALEAERKHFQEENNYDENRLTNLKPTSSDKLIKLWVQLDIKNEKSFNKDISLWTRIKRFFQNAIFSFNLKHTFGKDDANETDENLIMDIKAQYYSVRAGELKKEIAELTDFLKNKHADNLMKEQAALSMKVLKNALYVNYNDGKETRRKFTKDDLWKDTDAFTKEYPVVLSTTYSALSSLPKHVFDYLIIDEASQVPIESAALALSCAKNAIIVGDLKQLPNIITNENKKRIEQLNAVYKIDDKYNCLTNSFLSSAVKVFSNVPLTLLKEHYRCAPMIINFCNQKYYGGELIIMTKDDSEDMPMEVIKTVEGNHSRSISNEDKTYIFNQREVDEFLDLTKKQKDFPLEKTGIITPYRGQALLFHNYVKDNMLEADTIHKYQGREKDIIVLSTVVGEYNAFVDNPNLINVAVSRAKKKFILITNGNCNPKGNITDLIDYIDYNHGTIVQSNLHSIFDLLYSCYAEQRKRYLQGKKSVSDYDSENIAFNVISAILRNTEGLESLEIMPHYHLSSLIKDVSILSEDEYRYVRSSWSHVDFLIANRASKRPVLAIEVDGFAYHHKGTRQAERDKLKDSIFMKYDIPLLRLSTAGSSEIDKIKEKLLDIVNEEVIK